MIPPPVIQKIPSGLLSFFGLQTGGKNPDTLGNIVAPTMDAVPWYIALQREIRAAGPSNLAAVGAAVGFETVPPGEVWLVESFVCSTSALGAGQVLLMQPHIGFPPGPTNNHISGDTSNRATVGVIARARLSGPIVLPGGCSLAVTALELAAGPVAVDTVATIVRLRG